MFTFPCGIQSKECVKLASSSSHSRNNETNSNSRQLLLLLIPNLSKEVEASLSNPYSNSTNSKPRSCSLSKEVEASLSNPYSNSTNSKPRSCSISLLPSLEMEMNTVQSSFPRNWSELPGDVLAMIIEKLISTSSFSLSDYIRFGAVCSNWRFIFTRENYEHIELSSRLPMLLFLYPLHIKHDDNNKSTKSFYSISEKKVYNFQSPVPLHKKKKCVGSSHGWLITVDCDNKDHRSFELLNPFRSFNNVITLIPTLSKYVHIGTLKKFVLSADPWPSSSSKPAEDVVVMAINVFDGLRYCRLGDKVWTFVPWTYRNHNHDVIYYKGMFYAALDKGFMLVVDVGLHPLQKPKIISPSTTHLQPDKKTKIYLVECLGDLLQVFKVDSHTAVSTIRFEVYKQYIDNDHDSVRWVQMRDLNGFSFFLGVNASISVKAADFPGCKPDCIYFTGERYCDPSLWPRDMGVLYLPSLWPRDMGVFYLPDGSFKSHYPLNTDDKSIMPPPIWIQPMTQISDLIKLMTIN